MCNNLIPIFNFIIFEILDFLGISELENFLEIAMGNEMSRQGKLSTT